MQRYHRILSWFLAGIVLIAGGCSRRPTSHKKDKDGQGEVMVAPRDSFHTVIDTFRFPENPRATDDWTRFREGLLQLDNTFARPEIVNRMSDLAASERKFLIEEVHLTDEELAEIESKSFRTADAHYLDECFLMRDAARSLEVRGMQPLEQAERNFRWVMRNVSLHEEGDSWLPPAFVLRRGFGSALERSLVFLALLRQSNLEGCLLVVPETEPGQILVAVLDPKTTRLHLFDPRLGTALPGKEGKTIATLQEVQVDARLLEAARITPAQVKKWEAWLACPLNALSPRMLVLQQGLSAHDTIYLYLGVEQLLKDITSACNLPVKVWNPPVVQGQRINSPTRSLRLFLPKQEGGLDETGRSQSFTLSRLPIDQVALNYAQIGLFREWSEPAYDVLMNITADLFNKYDVQVREMFLRGLYEPALRRQERMKALVHNDALIGLLGDKVFLADVARWRKQMREAYENVKLRRDPGSQSQALRITQSLWAEDQFVGWLINLDNEEKLDRDVKKSTLTRILAIGVRESFDRELARTQASFNHEKAERAQASLQSLPRPGKAVLTKARDAWSMAKNSWANIYLDRIVPGADSLVPRLELVRERLAPEQVHLKISLLEHLHQELHQYFDARERLAECLEHLDEKKAAQIQWQRIRSEIEELQQKALFQNTVKNIRATVDALPTRKETLPLQRFWQQRLDRLARDWDEGGAFSWRKQHVRLQMDPVAAK